MVHFLSVCGGGSWSSPALEGGRGLWIPRLIFADDTVSWPPERVAAKCEAAETDASQSGTGVKERSRWRGGGRGLVQKALRMSPPGKGDTPPPPGGTTFPIYPWAGYCNQTPAVLHAAEAKHI